MSFIAAAVGIGGSIIGGLSARKAQKKAQAEIDRNAAEMQGLKDQYANLDTSNPYLNMDNNMKGLENTMEDLTVNQQQAQFEQQQNQQSQANILDSMRGSAGGSGIAATAQAMAQQGQLAAQKSSASIGAQESANQAKKAAMAGQLQMAEASEASRIQGMERQGEARSQQLEMDKTSTLLGMSQAETAAARDREAAAGQAKTDAFTSGIGSVVSMFSDRKLKKNIKLIGNSPSGLKIYAFEYIDKVFGKGVWQGVMSDEIPKSAVIKHESGYDMVDYSKLDVEFKIIK